MVDDRVVRGLSDRALTNYRAVRDSRFYQEFESEGKLVGTTLLSAEENPLATHIQSEWAGFLEHDVVPVISYPYEWCFSMLRDAALLQLELTEAAILNGFTVKDASPYNIQFIDHKPVFIDIPSLEPLPDGEPWAAYRQFCEMFLFPLLVQVYKGMDFQPFLRSRLDGIGVQTAASLFGLRDRFRRGVFTHVWLQAKMDRRFGGADVNVRSSLKSAGFNLELILANVRKLTRLIRRLDWSGKGSEWGDYEKFHNYTETDHQLKTSFVSEFAAGVKAKTIWDLGCNTGQFSKAVAAHCSQVLACDVDHWAIERLFRDQSMPSNVIPMVQNVADPSPDWGWRGKERRRLTERSKPDLVLCLALLHHVVITANIPLADFVAWLRSVADHLVIEYVSRADDKVRILLRNKHDHYHDYSREQLEAALAEHFSIESRLVLRDGHRCLMACRAKA